MRLRVLALCALKGGLFRLLAAAALGCGVAVPAAAFGPLSNAVEDALLNDPQYLSAIAGRAYSAEEENKALANLLPQASLSYSKAKTTSDQGSATSALGLVNPPVTYRYDSITQSLTIKQPLYRLRNWWAYLQSRETVSEAEHKLRLQIQQLFVRVLSALVDISQYRIAAVSAERALEAASLAWEQSSRLEGAGEAIAADRLDAEARYRQAQTDQEDGRRALALATRAYENITGRPARPVSEEALLRMQPAALPALQEMQEWLSKESPELNAKRASLRNVEMEIRKARSDHMPTLDLFATKSVSDNGSDISVGRKIDTTQIGIQLSIPIYSGGQTQALVRQALANARLVEEDLRALQRKLELDLERSYFQAQTGAERLTAARASHRAAEAMHYATQQGYGAGVRTRVDVLNTKSRLEAAQRDLARSAADFVKAYLQAWATAGRLDLEVIRKLDLSLATSH